jgi:ribosomal protein L6P/L9E
MIYLFDDNLLMCKLSLLQKINKHIQIYFKRLVYKEILTFKGTIYNFKGKIKIVGRGWKIVKNYSLLLIKLGFSHPLFINTTPYIKYKPKKKKKKYYHFYGTYPNEINLFISKFNKMRRPDTYTRKGIFDRKYIL